MILQTLPSDIDKTQWFVEWCPKFSSRSGRMLSLKGLAFLLTGSKDTGFSSNYVFSKQDADEIHTLGSSRGFSQYKVGAWHICLDLDEGKPQLDAVLSKLDAEGYGYWVYMSGGKGYHVYVPMDRFIISEHLPHSQKLWVEAVGLEVDTTIFQHGRIISLPGRVHHKTKVKKSFVLQKPGRPATVEIVERPLVEYNFSGDIGEGDPVHNAINGLSLLLSAPPSVGHRHTRLWGAASDFARAGFDFNTTLGLLTRINDEWTDKKTVEELHAAVKQAYGRCGQKVS